MKKKRAGREAKLHDPLPPDNAGLSPNPPTETTTEPPPPVSNPALAVLEARKCELEIEKLTEEIAVVRDSRSWWRKSIREVKVSEWFTVLTAIGLVVVGYSTGYFSTVRE